MGIAAGPGQGGRPHSVPTAFVRAVGRRSTGMRSARQHTVGECVGWRRQVPVDDKYGYCRLRRAQATWVIKASGKASAIDQPTAVLEQMSMTVAR